MIDETIKKIETRIQTSDNIDENRKNDLLFLIGELKTEIKSLETDQADSIVGFTGISAHEATRINKNEKLFSTAVEGLNSSVEEFEQSNPKLVEVVNSISIALSNLGI